jgi:ATP-dependent Lon protease
LQVSIERSDAGPVLGAPIVAGEQCIFPIENKRNFMDVSAEIMEQVDPLFYGDPKTAALKVLGAV